MGTVIRKYKAVVNDNSLEKIGAIKVTVSSNTFPSAPASLKYIEYAGDVTSRDSDVYDASHNVVEQPLVCPVGVATSFCFSQNGGVYDLGMKYYIKELYLNYSSGVFGLDTKELTLCSKMTNLTVPNNLVGDIKHLGSLEKIVYINANGSSNLYGDIKYLGLCPDLETIALSNTSVEGKIEDLVANLRVSQGLTGSISIPNLRYTNVTYNNAGLEAGKNTLNWTADSISFSA